MGLMNWDDLKSVHVGDVPAAKKGIIDSLSGKDLNQDTVPFEHFNSYKKGHEIGSIIENILKGDQRED